MIKQLTVKLGNSHQTRNHRQKHLENITGVAGVKSEEKKSSKSMQLIGNVSTD